jgi:hypothetical protein
MWAGKIALDTLTHCLSALSTMYHARTFKSIPRLALKAAGIDFNLPLREK